MHFLLKFKLAYSVLLRFKRRLFIPRDINGPLLAIKSLILYKNNKFTLRKGNCISLLLKKNFGSIKV